MAAPVGDVHCEYLRSGRSPHLAYPDLNPALVVVDTAATDRSSSCRDPGPGAVTTTRSRLVSAYSFAATSSSETMRPTSEGLESATVDGCRALKAPLTSAAACCRPSTAMTPERRTGRACGTRRSDAELVVGGSHVGAGPCGAKLGVDGDDVIRLRRPVRAAYAPLLSA